MSSYLTVLILMQNDYLLGYSAVKSGISLPTFQKCLLPASSGRLAGLRKDSFVWSGRGTAKSETVQVCCREQDTFPDRSERNFSKKWQRKLRHPYSTSKKIHCQTSKHWSIKTDCTRQCTHSWKPEQNELKTTVHSCTTLCSYNIP
jgi:hypothetical protein